jgi:hypothetical protein
MGIFSALGKKFLPGELSRDADPHVLPYFLADGQYYQSGKHRAEEAAMIALWLVRLRWVAICGFLVLAGCFLIFFRALMPIGALYGLCGVIFLYNRFFSAFKKPEKHGLPDRPLLHPPAGFPGLAGAAAVHPFHGRHLQPADVFCHTACHH